MLYVSVVPLRDVRAPSPSSVCPAHARMLLSERLATTHRALRSSVLSRVLYDWQSMGRGERLAAHRILTGLDEYDLEWQCEILVQEALLR